MKTKTTFDYFQEFTAEHNKLTDLELTFIFNSSVGISAFGVARQGYLWSIKEQLKNRKIDFSSIGNEKTMSYKYCVVLKNKKLYKITELEKEEVEKIFNEYFKNNYPEKLIFNPKILDYDNEQFRFGMGKHFGVLVMNTNKMLKEWQKE